jgi:hypothetical protein
VVDIQRSAEILTLFIEETRFTDVYPDGCTRTYTLVYTFTDETVLEFLSTAPTGGGGDVKVEDPGLTFNNGFFTLEGRFVNMSEGQAYHVRAEASGVETTFDLSQIFPDSSGWFSTNVYLDPPPGTFMIIEILANGEVVISTSGDAPRATSTGQTPPATSTVSAPVPTSTGQAPPATSTGPAP